jgi:hypothetical protein
MHPAMYRKCFISPACRTSTASTKGSPWLKYPKDKLGSATSQLNTKKHTKSHKGTRTQRYEYEPHTGVADGY